MSITTIISKVLQTSHRNNSCKPVTLRISWKNETNYYNYPQMMKISLPTSLLIITNGIRKMTLMMTGAYQNMRSIFSAILVYVRRLSMLRRDGNEMRVCWVSLYNCMLLYAFFWAWSYMSDWKFPRSSQIWKRQTICRIELCICWSVKTNYL